VPKEGTLLLVSDARCVVKVDGGEGLVLEAAGSLPVKLAEGEHVAQVFVDNRLVHQKTARVNAGSQTVLLLSEKDFALPKPSEEKKAPPLPATLLIRMDLGGRITVDGGEAFELKAGESRTVGVSLGQHVVAAESLSGGADRWEQVVAADRAGQQVVDVKLEEARQKRRLRQLVGDDWQEKQEYDGKYTNSGGSYHVVEEISLPIQVEGTSAKGGLLVTKNFKEPDGRSWTRTITATIRFHWNEQLQVQVTEASIKESTSEAPRAAQAAKVTQARLHNGELRLDVSWEGGNRDELTLTRSGVVAAVRTIQGRRLAREHDWAASEAEAAVRKYPELSPIRELYAKALAGKGDLDAAGREIRKIVDGSDDLEAWMKVAGFFKGIAKYAEMEGPLQEAEKLARSNREKALIYLERGVMYHRLGDGAKAEEEFRKILAIEWNSARDLNSIGYHLADNNVKLDEALAMIRRALKEQPTNANMLDSLGWVHFRLGQFSDAEISLKNAIQRNGSNGFYHDHLGDVYTAQSKPNEALVSWETALRLLSGQDVDAMLRIRAKVESARAAR
jgi:tetratricopeptide (TPR) repeat protein